MRYPVKPYDPLAWRWSFAWLPEQVSATERVWLEWYQWRSVQGGLFWEYKTVIGVWKRTGYGVDGSGL